MSLRDDLAALRLDDEKVTCEECEYDRAGFFMCAKGVGRQAADLSGFGCTLGRKAERGRDA